ncbi:RHS repeat-associated core domain-containing protein [Sorangium cellulosum]|uniref:Uncharacterized protein n=1 Tax=Sorangium cellulosum TaxID=56 RepID=A0A150QLG9_SORCE|nr:RHS repeat-associated core domain-containing protein [Sorangium cellulosum]KYF68845.1 hypothetical protein BE15_44730 [Sorangium cellulosum]
MVVTDAASTPWLYLHRDGRASEIDLGAFGRVTRATGDPGALRFAGQRADAVTGLHYNRHRFYDPATHVFLTPDPLGLLGALQEIGFVPNVTIFIDPSGLTTIVVGAPADATIQQHVAMIQAQNPGARVLRYRERRALGQSSRDLRGHHVRRASRPPVGPGHDGAELDGRHDAVRASRHLDRDAPRPAGGPRPAPALISPERGARRARAFHQSLSVRSPSAKRGSAERAGCGGRGHTGRR